jgi:hypothetical protein
MLALVYGRIRDYKWSGGKVRPMGVNVIFEPLDIGLFSLQNYIMIIIIYEHHTLSNIYEPASASLLL